MGYCICYVLYQVWCIFIKNMQICVYILGINFAKTVPSTFSVEKIRRLEKSTPVVAVVTNIRYDPLSPLLVEIPIFRPSFSWGSPLTYWDYHGSLYWMVLNRLKFYINIDQI